MIVGSQQIWQKSPEHFKKIREMLADSEETFVRAREPWLVARAAAGVAAGATEGRTVAESGRQAKRSC